MDAKECYVLCKEPCKECGGTGFQSSEFARAIGIQPVLCSCNGGWAEVKVPFIDALPDALRALGIDVPEPEDAPAVVCPP